MIPSIKGLFVYGTGNFGEGDMQVRPPEYVVITKTKDNEESLVRMIEALDANADLPYAHLILDVGGHLGAGDGLFQLYNKCVQAIILSLEDVQEHEVLNAAHYWLDTTAFFFKDNEMAEYPYAAFISDDVIVKSRWDKAFVEISELTENKGVLSPFIGGDVEIKGGSPRFSTREIHGAFGDYQLGLVMHLDSDFMWSKTRIFQDFIYAAEDEGHTDATMSKWIMHNGMYLAYIENHYAEKMSVAGDVSADD